jgi:hypothetical protein
MCRNLHPLCFVTLLVSCSLPATATSYSFSNIPFPYPTADNSDQAFTILNDGTVFGQYSTTASNCCIPYAYHNGQFTNYPTLPDGSPIWTVTGSNTGELAGTYYGEIPAKNGFVLTYPSFTEENGIYTKIPPSR